MTKTVLGPDPNYSGKGGTAQAEPLGTLQQPIELMAFTNLVRDGRC